MIPGNPHRSSRMDGVPRTALDGTGVPRMRGDDPCRITMTDTQLLCSPHARG